MGEVRRQKGKIPWTAVENFVAAPYFVTAFHNIDCFVLPMVDVQRRTAARRNSDNKIIESPASIIASNLENKVPAGA